MLQNVKKWAKSFEGSGYASPRDDYWQTSGKYVLGKQQQLRISEFSTKGVGIKELAEMAGHASIQTAQHYIDVNDERMQRAAELIWGSIVLTQLWEWI